MKVLLDTHAVLWWFADDPALPRRAEALIDDPSNAVLVSAASAWEICTKVRIGKLPTGQALCDDFGAYLERYHFTPLPISVEHGRLAGRLPGTPQGPVRPHAGSAGLGGRRTADDQRSHICGLWGQHGVVG